MATFSKRFNAQRAARRELKNDRAMEDIDFVTTKRGAEWFYDLIAKTPAPAPAAPEAPFDAAKEVEAAKAALAAKKGKPSAPAKKAKGPEAVKRSALVDALATIAKPDFGKPAAAAKPELVKYSKRATVEQAASRGILPSAPNFMAETHARYRKKLAFIVGLVEAGNVAELEALYIPTYSSSPRAMAKYRDLAVAALKAQAAAKADGRLLTDISVDENEVRTIANATSYSVIKMLGRGRKDREDAGSLGEARAKAEAKGPGTLIYAITPEGRSTLVETVPHK